MIQEQKRLEVILEVLKQDSGKSKERALMVERLKREKDLSRNRKELLEDLHQT